MEDWHGKTCLADGKRNSSNVYAYTGDLNWEVDRRRRSVHVIELSITALFDNGPMRSKSCNWMSLKK